MGSTLNHHGLPATSLRDQIVSSSNNLPTSRLPTMKIGMRSHLAGHMVMASDHPQPAIILMKHHENQHEPLINPSSIVTIHHHQPPFPKHSSALCLGPYAQAPGAQGAACSSAFTFSVPSDRASISSPPEPWLRQDGGAVSAMVLDTCVSSPFRTQCHQCQHKIHKDKNNNKDHTSRLVQSTQMARIFSAAVGI